MNRATFIQQLKMASAGAFFSPYAIFQEQPQLKKALLDKVGLQLFSAPSLLSNNLEEGLEVLQEMGYTSLETFGPYEFSTEQAKKSFAELAQNFGGFKGGLYGNNPQNFKKALGSLKVHSMHTDLETLEKNTPELIQAAQALGAKYVVLPMIPDELRGDLEAYKKMADRFNAIGKNLHQEGLRFAYHNHGFGFKDLNGTIPFHYLMQNTNPNTVFLELDVFWTTAAGQDPLALLDQYPNRYKLMHLKDMMPNDLKLTEEQGLYGLFPFFGQITPCGSGTINIEAIVAKGVTNGVDHFFVEHDMAPNPKEDLLKSAQYLLS